LIFFENWAKFSKNVPLYMPFGWFDAPFPFELCVNFAVNAVYKSIASSKLMSTIRYAIYSSVKCSVPIKLM
jgi:hypothetical protein